MTGKEFEALLARQFMAYREKGLASISRYGVQAIRTSPSDIITIKSLPDFEGLIEGIDKQVIFDAKVCSQASFDLHPFRDRKRRQLEHMLERSRYGATCGFLIHWPERQLKTKSVPATTCWFPVQYKHPFWDAFESAEVRRLNRSDCEHYGHDVTWTGNRLNLLKLFKRLGEDDGRTEAEQGNTV
jgi:penicillin-binding protein-related factor A (putative recombinase)